MFYAALEDFFQYQCNMEHLQSYKHALTSAWDELAMIKKKIILRTKRTVNGIKMNRTNCIGKD